IDELRKWWNVEPEKSFTWVVMVGEDYLSLLSNRHPEALIIFAHFCVLLKQAESIYWFKNWPRKLISAIYHSLDEAYRLWIRWPLEQIGYDPQSRHSHHQSWKLFHSTRAERTPT